MLEQHLLGVLTEFGYLDEGRCLLTSEANRGAHYFLVRRAFGGSGDPADVAIGADSGISRHLSVIPYWGESQTGVSQ